MMDGFDRRQQLIIVVTKLKEDEDLIREGLKSIPNIEVKFFNDPIILLRSTDVKQADVYIVSVDLGNYDGRNLYLEQKSRLRIVPFLFIVDRPVMDEDWDCLSVAYSKDLYDYLEKPLSAKKLKHRVNLMLTITHIYNMHTINTVDELRDFWKESVIRDREMLRQMREMYRKEK
jgi:response regulator RpfG family c-di-GMP phosphodiesterase